MSTSPRGFLRVRLARCIKSREKDSPFLFNFVRAKLNKEAIDRSTQHSTLFSSIQNRSVFLRADLWECIFSWLLPQYRYSANATFVSTRPWPTIVRWRPKSASLWYNKLVQTIYCFRVDWLSTLAGRFVSICRARKRNNGWLICAICLACYM